jgi:hypothetical protein
MGYFYFLGQKNPNIRYGFFLKGGTLTKKNKKFFFLNIIICTPIDSPNHIISKNVVYEIIWTDSKIINFKKLLFILPLKGHFK